MRFLYVGLCVLLLSLSLKAQEAKEAASSEATASDATAADPSGKWAWTQDMRGNEVSFELVLAKKDQSLTGTFQSIFANAPENFPADMAKPVDIKDAKLEGDRLTFNVVRDFNGNEFVSKFEGTIKGDQIVGKRVTNFGGQDRESEWTAKRAGLSVKDVVGNWTIKVNTPNGEIEEKINFEEKEGTLQGVFHSSFFGDSPLKNIKIEGDKLLFEVAFSNNEFSMDISYVMVPKGDKITGKASLQINGEDMSIDVEGKKSDAATKPATE